MALRADLLFDLFVEIIVMTSRTLVMSGPLVYNGALFFGHVAGVAIQPDLFHMVVVQVKWRLRLLRLLGGIGRAGRAIFSGLSAIGLEGCT